MGNSVMSKTNLCVTEWIEKILIIQYKEIK